MRACRARTVVPVPRPRVRVAAAAADDFDSLLMKVADKWEKADNKPVVVGYIAAGVAALWFSEWLIHLPGLNILLGFPIQLVGLLALPVLGLRYFVDGKDYSKDLSDVTDNVVSKLPGLKK